MKKTFLLISSSVVIGGAVFFAASTRGHANASGSPSYETGSPGDGGNCTDCHGGTAATGGTITSNIPVSGYVAGTAYTFSATITGSSSNNYGFEASCQNTTGTVIGTLSAPGSGAKLQTSSKFITHNAAATGTSKTWTWTWTAPSSSPPATVTMYAAFLVGNNNGADNGDATKVTSKTYSLSTGTTGIEEVSKNTTVAVYPNPAVNALHVSSPEDLTKGYIYGIDGKMIREISAAELTEKVIQVSDLTQGHYLVVLKGEHNYMSSRFVKQ